MQWTNRLLLILFLVLLPPTARADEMVIRSAESQMDIPDLEVALRLSFDASYYPPGRYDWLDGVAMRESPAGSLLTQFDGLHEVTVKHIREHYRRFARRAIRNGWMIIEDRDLAPAGLYGRLAHAELDPLSNGNWWDRNWWESLPSEKGGAPRTPYIQTIGTENSWRWGPFTATNTLKIHFNYVAFFEIQPDSVAHDHAHESPRVALDVRAAQSIAVGTEVSFDVNPRIRIGLPEGGDMVSALRSLSMEASFSVMRSGLKLIEGQIECRWEARSEFSIVLEVSFVNW